MPKRQRRSDASAIVNMAAAAGRPTGRTRKLADPHYAELVEILRQFVFARHERKHCRGVNWLIAEGIPELNRSRVAAGQPEIPSDVTDTTLLAYARATWPEEAKAFRR